MKKITAEEARKVLSLPMPDNDANAATVKDYLIALLSTLWNEKEGFSGKRPFGNSGWEGDLERALYDAKLIEGRVDEDGWMEAVDETQCQYIIATAINELGK